MNIKNHKFNLLLLFIGLSVVSYSQEGPNGSSVFLQGPPCSIPANASMINCNLIVYCYDASGNRIYRFAPNCKGIISVGSGNNSSNYSMSAPPNSQKVVEYKF